MHYNNPDLDKGVIDNGGTRFYYTTKLRQHDLGIFLVGDFLNPFPDGVPIGNGIVQHVHECPSLCSFLSTGQKVTVHREVYHAHLACASIKMEVIRNNKVRHIGRADFFDANQQGAYMVQQPSYTVEPGDAFRLTCTYESYNDVVWGPSTYNEMCQGGFCESADV